MLYQKRKSAFKVMFGLVTVAGLIFSAEAIYARVKYTFPELAELSASHPYTIAFGGREKRIELTIEDKDLADAGGNYPSVSITNNVNAFLTTMRQYHPKQIRTSKGAYGELYTVEEEFGKITVLSAGPNPVVLYDFITDMMDAKLPPLPPDEDGDEYSQHSIYGTSKKVLSMVGPLVSTEVWESGYYAGAMHPYAYTGYAAYDLSKGNGLANLLDYFREDDVVKALKDDSFLQGVFIEYEGDDATEKRRAFSSAKTFAQLSQAISAVDNCEWHWDSEKNAVMSSFAIYDYDITKNLASVRIGLPYGCESARGMLTQLGLRLAPNSAGIYNGFQEVLTNVKNGTYPGLLMKDRK